MYGNIIPRLFPFDKSQPQETKHRDKSHFEEKEKSIDEIENAPDDLDELFEVPPTLDIDFEEGPTVDDLKLEEMDVDKLSEEDMSFDNISLVVILFKSKLTGIKNVSSIKNLSTTLKPFFFTFS